MNEAGGVHAWSSIPSRLLEKSAYRLASFGGLGCPDYWTRRTLGYSAEERETIINTVYTPKILQSMKQSARSLHLEEVVEVIAIDPNKVPIFHLDVTSI